MWCQSSLNLSLLTSVGESTLICTLRTNHLTLASSRTRSKVVEMRTAKVAWLWIEEHSTQSKRSSPSMRISLWCRLRQVRNKWRRTPSCSSCSAMVEYPNSSTPLRQMHRWKLKAIHLPLHLRNLTSRPTSSLWPSKEKATANKTWWISTMLWSSLILCLHKCSNWWQTMLNHILSSNRLELHWSRTRVWLRTW